MRPKTKPSKSASRLLGSLALALVASQASAYSELSIEFTGTVTGFSGPAVLDPFFISDPARQFEGQFFVRDFDPTFTGTLSLGDAGVAFLLHTAQLERIEAHTLRRADNVKVLVPRQADVTDVVGTGFFGEASVTFVNGTPTSFTYSIDRDALEGWDFIFDGFFGAAPGYGMSNITVNGGTLAFEGSYDLSDPATADLPYGLNVSYPFPGNDVNTTRAEASDPTLGLDSRLPPAGFGDPNPVSFGTDGTLYRYTSSSFEANVTAVPEPETYALLALGLVAVGVAARRRKP